MRRTPMKWTLGRGVTVVALIIGAVAMIMPFLWMFSTSLRPVAESITLPPKWLPTSWDWSNYQRLGSDEYPILTFLKNSVVVATLSTVGILVTSSLAGYAFAKMEFRGRDLLFGMLLLSLMIPVQVTIVPLYLIMQTLGLMDSVWALILPALLGAMAPGIPGAFGIFLMRQFFRGIPDGLIEAARLDGAGPMRTFWSIVLPLAKPAMVSLALIVFIFSWNDYFAPLVFLNSADSMTLSVGIQALRPPFGQGSSLVLAAVTLAIVPVLIMFIAGQRWIVQGFVSSGLKD